MTLALIKTRILDVKMEDLAVFYAILKWTS